MLIKPTDTDIELRYASWLKMMIDLIQPKNLFSVIGRGGAKTTDIMAERSMDVIYDLPGAPFALVGDTYMNLHKNVVKSLIEGWQRKGWTEGVHYVIGEEPPIHFAQSFNRIVTYKNTISVFNGCNFTLVSMDRPSSGAGSSYVHIFGDEAKYLKKDKVNKLMPAIRGDYVRFGHSPFYRGMTFTSDMPNPILGEDPWMLDMETLMDKKQIQMILDASFILNDVKKEYFVATRNKDADEVRKREKNLRKWEERLSKIRKNSTLFYIASSFVNSDMLTEEFFSDALGSLGLHEYTISVLSMKAGLERGALFYGNLSAKHFYLDGTDYTAYDTFGLKDNIIESSKGLKYIQHDRLLEAGVDFGNMMSMVIGQRQGNTERALKFIYTLTPEWIDDLAKKFVEYFKPHKSKVLHMRYDRAGNNYRDAKKDLASELKRAIEYQDDKPTGWTVILKSIGQRNVTHLEEFTLVSQILNETNKSLPLLRIDTFNCKELKSSMHMAPLMKSSKGEIKKQKTSEKLPLKRLPLESTNPSDAFKYWICKPEYLLALKGTSTRSQAAGIRGSK